MTNYKLQVDEETCNNDIEEIKHSILDISDDLAFYEASILDILSESLMEIGIFI